MSRFENGCWVFAVMAIWVMFWLTPRKPPEKRMATSTSMVTTAPPWKVILPDAGRGYLTPPYRDAVPLAEATSEVEPRVTPFASERQFRIHRAHLGDLPAFEGKR